VVFTLRRRPGLSDEDFRADTDAVAADLTRLKRVLEDANRRAPIASRTREPKDAPVGAVRE
jgi:hypothetical protein